MTSTDTAQPTDQAIHRQANIEALIAPNSIAIVGASTDPGRLGGRSLAYLLKVFPGALYPVNPRRSEVQGLPSYPSVDDIPETPDLVLILVSAEEAVLAAEASAHRGARASIVFSSGFSEASEHGRALQTRLAAVSRETGMRILGPNTNGLLAVPTGTWATFAGIPDPPLPVGSCAMVSQSGAFAYSAFQMASEEGIPLAYFCGTGNEADVTVAEMLEYFVEKPDISILLGYAEAITDVPRLIKVADRARDLDKPLLFLKAGRSAAGTRAALSHTGSVAGTDSAADAVFERHGILRAQSVEQMLRWAIVLSSPKRPLGRRAGILTASGGMGIVLADTAEQAGLQVPELGADTQADMMALLPDFAGTSNPVDVTGQVVNDPDLFDNVLAAMSRSGAVDMLLIAGLGGKGEPAALQRAHDAAAASDKPFIVWRVDTQVVLLLRKAGVPAFRDSAAAVDAGVALARYSSFTPFRPDAPSAELPALRLPEEATGVLLERDARRALAPFGVPQLTERVVATKSDVLEAAHAIGYPVALKALSDGYLHKSDVGAVALGLTDDLALAAAFDGIEREVESQGYRVSSYLIQEMAPPGIEMIVGLRRDATFGPIVSVGIGGTLVEIIAEVRSRPAPLSKANALQAIAELCHGRLVTSKRGLMPDQQAQLADLMVQLGNAAIASERIIEVDLNPVIVAASGLYVVDAAMVLSPPPAL